MLENQILFLKNKKCYFKIYANKFIAKIIQRGIEDFQSVVFSVSDTEIEVQKVSKLSKEKNGVVIGKFTDFDGLTEQFYSDYVSLKSTEGYAIRYDGTNIYILADSDRGVFYGIHDFLEKNIDVVWARGAEDYAMEILPTTTIFIKHFDYSETPCFKIRVWNTNGEGTAGIDHGDRGTAICFGRNKMNGVYHHCDDEWYEYGIVGQSLASADFRCIDDLIPTHPEYFMTDESGNPKKTGELESYINYYNPDVPKEYAKRMTAYLDKCHQEDILGWNMPDNPYFCMVHNGVKLHEQPFTADDGTVVYPEQKNYKSTVYFNFINRLIKELNKLRPNTYIQTQAYMYSLQAPAIRVDDKVIIKVASLGENEKISQTDAARADNYDVRDNILAWTKMSDNICINAYWNCFKGDIYSRPLLKVIQENMLWWKKIGVIGFTPDGKVDCSKLSSYSPKQQFARKFYDMNEMYTWCLCKLMWNPDQDVSDLKTRYCKIVYKECANEMLEYFRLIEKGFDSQDAFVWYATGADVYIYLFIVKAGIQNAVLETLKKAVDKATTPNVKSKVESIYSILFESISRYEDFVEESAEMLYCQGINPLEKTELDYRNNADSIWNKAKPCTVLRNYMDLSFYNPAANFSCKMLYDDKNLYFGYQIYDDAIQRVEETKKGLRLYREDGSVVVSRAETYFGGNSLNQNVYYGLVSGFNKDEVIDRLFYNDGVAHEMPIPPGMLDVKQVFLSDDPKERSYFHIQVVPIAFLGVAKENLKPYGHFVYFADRYGRAGWMGFGLWSKENFSMFKLIEGKKEK